MKEKVQEKLKELESLATELSDGVSPARLHGIVEHQNGTLIWLFQQMFPAQELEPVTPVNTTTAAVA